MLVAFAYRRIESTQRRSACLSIELAQCAPLRGGYGCFALS
jgi:hypothetical protein